MTEILNIGVIGLGVMGQRMLERLKSHDRLRPTLVWDANAQALQQTLQAYPQLRAAASAEALLATPGLHTAYIATPPAAHLALANAAFDAGLAVLCEKPLTTDFDGARRTIARIAAEDRRDAVNFSLASSPGLQALKWAWADGSLGVWESITIELSFAAWPRPWQSGAGAWLSERVEGGFSREVLSHFIFVLQHVLGPAEVVAAQAAYPADGRLAETSLKAELRMRGVPVHIDAAVRGDVADVNRVTVTGSQGALRLQEWFGLSQRRGSDGAWAPVSAASSDQLRQQSQRSQLDHWAAMVDGQPHGLPRFAEALAVQETIEALLAGS